MKMSNKLLYVLMVVFLLIFVVNPTYINAVDENLLKIPKAIPGTFKYKIGRAWEKVYISFIFSNKGRVEYHNKLLDKRLAELNYLVNNKELSLIEDSSSRFSYQVGVLAETLEFEESGTRTGTIAKFKDYASFLASLRDEFPANSSNWLFIQQNIDTLNIFIEKLNK